MKLRPLLKAPWLLLLSLILASGLGRAADRFFVDLSAQLTSRGLPAATPTSGDSEDKLLSSFEFVQVSGQANETEVSLSGLPFTKALRVQSQSAPDQPWQQFLQHPTGRSWNAGDTGLLIFSVHAIFDGPAALEAAIKGADNPYPILADLQVTPTRAWTTIYLPFRLAAKVNKAQVGFFFGSHRQTLEIGGVAVFDFGPNVTLDALHAAIAQMPTDLKSTALGQSDSDNLFPFLTPWDDAKPNFLDVSSLNDGPAGSHGFIIVKNGHFVESATGNRVRFFGTNLGLAEGIFPSHADAEKIAAHLAKYGINVVRLNEDTTWDGPQNDIWDARYPDHRHIDAEKLEKTDYLVAQLEKHGIYIDLCLHMTRQFTPADGFPDSVNQLPFPFDKRVDIFDPQMITIDQEYFRDLITHLNPYTAKAYAADPGVLNLEINNENSLMGLYGDKPGSKLNALPETWSGLPEPYYQELTHLWNAWLLKKYGTTAKLAAAWKMEDRTTGANLYPPSDDPSRWTLESQRSTAASLSRDDGGLKVDVTKVDGTGWHVQFYQKNLGLLHDGTKYTLTMEMKADKKRDQKVQSNLDVPPFGNLGLEDIIRLDTGWQTYTFWFTAQNAQDGHNRLPALILGNQTGATWIRHVTLKEGIGGYTLPPNQTLEAANVPVEPLGEYAARADWLSFLADTEAAYVKKMTSYLRNDLGAKSLIFCSQTSFGGLWGNYREAASDYTDHHGYWDYHNTFSEPITNTPMLLALGHDDPLTDIALERTAGQPTSVTEYNICFPNEYRAEAVPEYASFAAFQDWDAIFLFIHTGYGAIGARLGENDRMQAPLEASVDPGIWGFMPSATLMFRHGLVPVAPSVQTLGLPAQFPAGQVAAGLNVPTAWQATGALPLAPFSHRVQLGLGLPSEMPDPAASAGALHVQTDDPHTARYTADAPDVKVISGFVGGQTIALSGATVKFGALTNNFGVLTLCAMDGQPLAQSARVLLTLVTHTQNTGQKWNDSRTVLTIPGHGPPLVDEAAADISFAADGPRTVVRLDSSGDKQDVIPSTYQNGNVSFSITPAQKSIWYAITRDQ